jgi:hypothetical protein
MSASPAVPGLELPEEPVALGAETRAMVERSPGAGAGLIDRGEWIVGPLWRCWGAALERAGMSRAQLVQIAVGYRGELWLWVMGERTWAQCASGLRGRVLRRLSPVAPPPDAPQD